MVYTAGSSTMPSGCDIWKCSNEVRVLGRVQSANEASVIMRRSDGDRVQFIPLPFYHGPMQYLWRSGAVQLAIRKSLRSEDAVILRSGHVANCLAAVLQKYGHPYGVEVIGDPYDVFAPGANAHPLRCFLRWWYPRQLRQLCARAAAVAYVTADALQKRYPASRVAFSTNYSSIQLQTNAFVEGPRNIRARACALLAIGTMDQPYKGHDVLLRALRTAINEGQHLTLVIVGDGRLRKALNGLARTLGLEGQVSFVGQLAAGAPVRAQMDRADLFVLPSRTEGLPRVLIEAMARAMPCVSTTVGGTPELLPAEDRVQAGNPHELAAKLVEVSGDVGRLNRMSQHNLKKSREYCAEILSERRRRFYRHMESVTLQWLRRGCNG